GGDLAAGRSGRPSESAASIRTRAGVGALDAHAGTPQCAPLGASLLRPRRGWRPANMLKSLCVAAVLALGASPALAAAVVVSSKLSSESAMIGQMIRLLLKAHGIESVDRTKIGA